jgi:hypothetical protein
MDPGRFRLVPDQLASRRDHGRGPDFGGAAENPAVAIGYGDGPVRPDPQDMAEVVDLLLGQGGLLADRGQGRMEPALVVGLFHGGTLSLRAGT